MSDYLDAIASRAEDARRNRGGCPVCRMDGAHKLDCPKRETMDKEYE